MTAFPEDWAYQLATQMLDAAVSCGASCERRYVSATGIVEGMPVGCCCQLVAVPIEGYFPQQTVPARGAIGAVQKTCDVRLVLDYADGDAEGKGAQVGDVVALNGAGRAASILRWQVLTGLWRAWAQGQLPRLDGVDLPPGVALAKTITPSGWMPAEHQGAAARWQTVWRFHL